MPPAIRRRRLLLSIANHSVAIVLSIAFLVPFVFILATALMTNQQALTATLWPDPFQWSNFTEVFRAFPFVRYTFNTLTYAVLATVGVVLSSVPVAYALSRHEPYGIWGGTTRGRTARYTPSPCPACAGAAARPPSCSSWPP